MTDNKLPVFETYRGALFCNYKQTYTLYQNKHFDNKMWHSIEWLFIRIGFEKKLYGTKNLQCDGHTLKGIVFFGLWIGHGYGCIAKPTTEKLLD